MALAISAFAFAPQAARAQEQAPQEHRWEKAIKKFEAQDKVSTAPLKNGIVFVGSSSIGGWKVHDYFPDLPVLNRGFGGSQTDDVVHFYSRVVKPYEPQVVVFYSGDNDVSAKKTSDTIGGDVRRLVELIEADFPKTTVVLIPPKPSISRWALWPVMEDVGRQEKAIADEKPNVIYMEIKDIMIGEDGKPKPEYFLADKLHMTPAAYKAWSERLRPILDEHYKKPE